MATSIPLRKGSNLNRKSVETCCSAAVNTEKSRRPSDNEEHIKPMTYQTAKKELLDEITRLQNKLGTQENRLKEVQTSLKSSQDELKKVKTEASDTKEKCETILLNCQIDPITVQRITPEVNDEDNLKLLEARDRAKAKVEVLTERITSLNTTSRECLDKLKGLCSELDGIDCLT